MQASVPRPGLPTLAKQIVNIQRLHPGLRAWIECGKLVAEGTIRGNALTCVYRIRVEYRPEAFPRAFVLSPPLKRRRPDQPVAHTFSSNEPCLFTKEKRDWQPGMYLGESLLPWLMEWIVHYELWRATGVWCGSGSLPEGYSDSAELGPEAT